MEHLFPIELTCCENSPHAIFMKTSGQPVDLTFIYVTPQSVVDKNKAVVICVQDITEAVQGRFLL